MNDKDYFYIKDISKVGSKWISEILLSFRGDNDIICFACIEEILAYLPEEKKEFILSNHYCKSDKWIFQTRPSNLKPVNLIWFRVLDRESIIKALSLDSLFRCIVLENGQSLENASYTLYILEDEYSQELCIEAISKEHFLSCVLPKIKGFNKSLNVLGWDKRNSELITL